MISPAKAVSIDGAPWELAMSPSEDKERFCYQWVRAIYLAAHTGCI
jgi:hypothetical protein